MSGLHRVCCCDLGAASCYCGSPCLGCFSSCDAGGDKCITAAEWSAHIGDVAGSGSGLLVAIDGVWYFFDGTPGPCSSSIARSSSIDWETAVRVDECPSVCGRTVRVRWTGSATYAGVCCDGGTGTYNFDSSFTATHVDKLSPEFDLSDCLNKTGDTTPNDVDAGDGCGESFNESVDDLSVWLTISLRLVGCNWEIRVNGQGVADRCPNEAAGTGWLLVFTAPGSVCPPSSGWSIDWGLSTLPIVDDPECDSVDVADVMCTAFAEGTVVVEF